MYGRIKQQTFLKQRERLYKKIFKIVKSIIIGINIKIK